MSVSSSLVAIAAAIVFAVSASYQVQDFDPLRKTIQALGLSVRTARGISRILPIAEICLAALIVAQVPVITSAALASFGGGLVMVGVVGLRSGQPIPCSCFGESESRTLGWPQVGYGTTLMLAAGLLALSPYKMSAGLWAVSMSVVCLSAMAIRAFALRAVLRELRYSRLSLSSTLPA
jgi:hypothetical protein